MPIGVTDIVMREDDARPAYDRFAVAGVLVRGKPRNFQLVRGLAAILGAEYGSSRLPV